MSSAMALPRTGFKFLLTVRDGPDAGASFQLLPPRVTIGRGGDNSVALSDPRVSRQAAVIEFSIEQIVIKDVSGREAMNVNGYAEREAALKDGDLIQIGETELKFIVEALHLDVAPMRSSTIAPVIGAAGGAMAPRPSFTPPDFVPPGNAASGAANGGPRRPRPAQSAPSDNGGKLIFYIVVGVCALAFYYFMDGQKVAAKKKESGITTTEQIETSIKGSELRTQAIEKRHFKSEEERTRSVEAQRHYMEGFRDYKKGQFSRAIRSFETAQAIDPGNELAGRYKKLAEKQRDEMINQLTIEGRRYREKSMYGRCSASFEKVLDAIPNRQDVKYKAAEALKKECDAMTDERFK